MSEPNVLLAHLIQEAGMSNAGLASRVNARLGTRYDHTAVARWIRDRAVPRGRAPEAVCTVLTERIGRTVTRADIGMEKGLPRRPVPDLESVMRHTAALWHQDGREEFFLADARPERGPDVVVPAFVWENPPGDADVSGRGIRSIGETEIIQLQQARERYQEMYRRVGGLPVRRRLGAFLARHATEALNASYPDATGRRLHRTVGGLTALAGICAYDARRQALAQRYFFAALRMAKASGDRGFGAYVVALLANQAMSMGEYRLVIQYSETALRATGASLSPALVSDLCTMQARAYARIGDRLACHAQMTRSESAAGHIRTGEEPSEASYVQPGLVETQHAEALRQLGDLTAAERYAVESLAMVEQAHPRGQVHRFAGLAMVRAQAGRVDEALEPAWQMLARVRGMESGRLHDRVRSVRSALVSRSAEPGVREFAEHADAELRLPL
ncbi:transcriptional regulator [Actinorugispora endophytica]|uniref:Transcriptional regulator n=1 Tax=Actinorugispora endophytica TaxID=1605990 RepID=A0A4R6UF84_9ACTN|nr:transcriptional regulator [Actinorugispora endophytica]TDQ45388.1 transcriptional regulator [Actinorugispora endophytica]